MITKRYKMPFAMTSGSVRSQVASFERDASAGIVMSGAVIEQDVSFNDNVNTEIVAAMHASMLEAGWTFMEDAPADEPRLIIVGADGKEHRVGVDATGSVDAPELAGR